MQRQVIRLTRKELYEKMWLRPAISLAEEFGISGRGLGKICSRFGIPVPPRGYWVKLAVGKHVTRGPLPTTKSDVPSEILIQPPPESPAVALPEQVRAEVTAVLENSGQIRVPETVRSPRPIVKRWLEQKRERRKVDQLSGRRSEPPLDATERRKLRILSAILNEIEKLGHAVKETRGEAHFEIASQSLDYKISELSVPKTSSAVTECDSCASGGRNVCVPDQAPAFDHQLMVESFDFTAKRVAGRVEGLASNRHAERSAGLSGL